MTSAVLAESWWMVALRGVIAILFGLVAFFLPGITMLSLVLVFAAYSFTDGLFGVILAVRSAVRRDRWVLPLLNGLLGIAVAAITVVWPGITVLAFVFLIAAWALISSGLMAAAAYRQKTGRGWLIFGAIVSLIYAVLLVIAPLIGAIVLTWWIGAHALVLGCVLLVLAFKLRSRRVDAERLFATREAAAESV
jgi:uncharacterized membrane protein HdeD (DUF308 family)